MNVHKGTTQRDFSFLIGRLARRILDQFGPDHRWKEDDMTWFAAHWRVQHMTEEVMYRYIWWLMREPVDLKKVASFRESVCETCLCGSECAFDHSAGISIRDIMIYLICEAVVTEVERLRFDYFAAA